MTVKEEVAASSIHKYFKDLNGFNGIVVFNNIGRKVEEKPSQNNTVTTLFYVRFSALYYTVYRMR